MGRVCCYLTSGDDFYCSMVLTSIYMLRQYNKKIPIRVFVISDDVTKIDKYASSLGIEVIHKEATESAKSSGYFCLNRKYMNECKEDSVLHIDGDTFIFDDIEKIIDRYFDKDFAGASDDWITGTTDWDSKDLTESYNILNCDIVPVFNGGLTLWNNGSIRGWCNEWLDKYCEMCFDKELPISKWLYNDKRNCYHRETFSICFYVGKEKLSYSLMDRKDVVNLFCQTDWSSWNNKNYIVYHCFTQNWPRLVKHVINPKSLSTYKLYQNSILPSDVKGHKG